VTTDPLVIGLSYLLLAGLGVIVGSFLNVVIYRVPDGKSIVRPASACPGCGTPIAARDNIPVLSWLLLRGRCRTCHAPISARYPLVEALTGVVWVVLGWWCWGPDGIDPLLPLLLALGSAGVALWFIDLDHHRLPDVIVLPLYPVTVIGLALAGLVTGEWPLADSLVGLAAWLLLIGGLWLFSGGRAMGFGDVKLAPVLGATLGWVGISSALVGLLAAFVLGGVLGVVLLVSGRARRGTHMPFGPFLLLGALIGLLAGEAIGAAYLAMVGL
jgi:leader peptidase (prepilin peptidase) / N-methyltransferase